MPRGAGAQDRSCFRMDLFAHVVTGSAHRAYNVIGDAVAADVAESTGEPSGNPAASALEKELKHFRSITDRRNGCASVGCIVRKERRRAGDQRCGQREQTEPVRPSPRYPFP